MTSENKSGPLAGLRVIEFAGLGPAPFCAMLLADMGAEAIRVDRLDIARAGEAPTDNAQTHRPRGRDKTNVVNRNRRSVALNLKSESGRETALRLIDKADVLLEGFRPGVMERLGLGPEPCSSRNPRLVYGRMTGWGQQGPLAQAAGHDINYIALSGALHAMGDPDRPPRPPLNLVGDYGGGGMLLAVGVLAALHERQQSGRGQIIDAAMCDGSALLMSLMYGLKAAGAWQAQRGRNFIDGSAHYYRSYACSDGKFIAVGPLEPQFYALLLQKCGVTDNSLASQQPDTWSESSEKWAALFARKTRDEWCALLEGSDACVTPVLDMEEAPLHPHNKFRDTFIDIGGVVQPAPAPRFSRSQLAQPKQPSSAGRDSEAVLADWGFSADEIEALKREGEILSE